MLTRQKKLFCDLYLSNGFNAVKAAIDAGYRNVSIRQKAYRIKNDPECKEYINACIEEKEEKFEIGKNEVFKLLSDKIRGEAMETHAFTIREGTKTQFVETIQHIELRIKQRDILKAIEIYAKLRGWDKEKEEKKPNIIINNNIPKKG